MNISFDVFFKKNIGTIYKDNSITTLGKEATVNLDLNEVLRIYTNFKVNENSYTDNVELVDINTSLIRVPFKTDVIKEGVHEFELVAVMKNGDVLPSQTYSYRVDKSLENPNAVETDTNYPVLIELLDLAGNKLIDMDKSIQKVDTSIENMTNEISSYKEATTNELEESFNNYSNNTTSNIARVLDNKIVEVDNVVSAKSNELDVKFTTKSNEITKTLNDEINKVNTTLTNKVNEVDRVLDTTVATISAELDKKSKEVDNKVNAKIVEIDNRVNAKINEVDTSLNNKINEVNEIIEEVEASEQARKEEHTELVNELSSYSNDMNNVKDRVDTLESKVTDNEAIVDLKNKVNNHETRIKANENTIKHHDILLKSLNILDETISIENEEGTVISLPQSKDGIITIDELQGNTLVNYCTNGSEELTLNNEINVEGISVTLTDTVEGGKVDVILEGNTLILDEEGNEVEAGTEGARLVSVGELEDNKIEVVGQSKNLSPINTTIPKKWSGNVLDHKLADISLKPNTSYVISNSYDNKREDMRLKIFNSSTNKAIGEAWGNASDSFTTDNDTLYYIVAYDFGAGIPIKNIQLEEGEQATSYVPYASNIYSIQLSEPLRGLPNGVCDKFVKQGGKWYVERNCKLHILNGSENWNIETEDFKTNCYYFKARVFSNVQNYPAIITSSNAISNRFNILPDGRGDIEGLAFSKGNGFITFEYIVPKNKFTSYESAKEEMTNDLKNNSIQIIYQLETPIYEPLEIDPTLTTYLDTTHISTNSTIPCNMQIKNSGYNAIIKPSTLYTVAFDTDKSGEVNIDLGGAKTSTTNNVATITTPSTLSNDTLTLYGKDIKASNVRLLEGDKTNYIPSYFEGMKSCFEDKEQDNGSYEVEIISNNKNLFNWSENQRENYELGLFQGSYYGRKIKLKPNTYYTLSTQPYTPPSGHWVAINGFDLNTNRFYQVVNRDNTGTTSNNSISPVTLLSDSNGYIGLSIYIHVISDIHWEEVKNFKLQIEEGRQATFYTPHESSKIQLQLNEPLRAVGDVKDRFVLKDGKLMIERNCGIREYQEGDFELDNTLTDKINTVYVLNEPMYEEVPFETQKLILECFENGTLFIDTLIPPTVSVTYSANKPVVAKLNQVDNSTNINTEDIAITQMAVDFLLMSSLGEEMINFKIKGGTNMSAYFASRIIKGALKYEDVIRKYPNYKEDIDLILIAEGYSDLIVEL